LNVRLTETLSRRYSGDAFPFVRRFAAQQDGTGRTRGAPVAISIQ